MFGLEAVFRNGVPVGHLRRSDYGFFIDKTIGYGYIRNPDGGVVSRATNNSFFFFFFDWCICLTVSFSCKYMGGKKNGPEQLPESQKLVFFLIVANPGKWNNPSVICRRL